ncbi:restriction endonuclease subunit S [Kocuria coralli]|uniref:Restriction endonuclease subunit S n=1 Tax=Kocuria coralli TaxID=1461025 RepID=A0A5J5KWS7_9MICC|nr:restriction endonuclease subunit S [Kocuria coralli]KAA9393730.1 restriction endonuclease subunit S [Kocuria coralli]
MSRIDELVQELCPDGVEFVTLESVAKTVPGLTGKTKADFSDGNARYVTYKNAFSNLAVDDAATDFVKVEQGERQNLLRLGDVVITGSSENVDEVGMSSVVTREPLEPLYLNSFCFALRFERPALLPEFSKHLFRGEATRKQIRKAASGVTRINVSKPRFMKIRIPVPPLEVQREIVRVLDKFTQLEAELEAELEARRAQYDHYRRKLLDSGDAESGRMLPLGEIFEMRAGTHIKAAEISDEPTEDKPYPCYGGNGLRGYVSSYNYDGSVIFVGRQGALCGNVHRADGKIYATEHAVVVTPKVPVDMSWAFHKLTEMDLNQYKTKSAQPGLAVGRVKQVEAQYVPVDDQRRDGEVLDKLDGLVNDISIGLPAELTARRKQYEHYRDRLLTFKEAAG